MGSQPKLLEKQVFVVLLAILCIVSIPHHTAASKKDKTKAVVASKAMLPATKVEKNTKLNMSLHVAIKPNPNKQGSVATTPKPTAAPQTTAQPSVKLNMDLKVDHESKTGSPPSAKLTQLLKILETKAKKLQPTSTKAPAQLPPDTLKALLDSWQKVAAKLHTATTQAPASVSSATLTELLDKLKTKSMELQPSTTTTDNESKDLMSIMKQFRQDLQRMSDDLQNLLANLNEGTSTTTAKVEATTGGISDQDLQLLRSYLSKT